MNDTEILKRSREHLTRVIEAESAERDKMRDDLRFATLDQWPEDVRRAREGDIVNGPRPCLTIDQIQQYITNVSNDMMKNRPAIKPRPVDSGADVATAKIFAGLIRHIEDQSSAKIAYQSAGESAVTIGLGYGRVTSRYVAPDSFDQELIITRVPDTFCVYLGSHSMPDGRDAMEAWVIENVNIDAFKSQYPKANTKDADFGSLGDAPTWKTENEVAVCEYFYIEEEPEELLFLASGQAVWKADYDAENSAEEITGSRMSARRTTHWCKHTGVEVLEKRDLKSKYIPIFQVVGKEKIVDGKKTRWGLVRPAKDALRAFNYWVSALTEKMALAPKAPFIGAVGQFKTDADRWDRANVDNFSRLEYDAIDINGNAVPAPRRQDPMQMEPAMVQMISMMQNFVKSALGMYKAAVGEAESQQSGRAILALQRESDMGTAHFGENQNIGIEHCGRILIDMIPKYYDKRRVIRILGEDGKEQNVTIDPGIESSHLQARQSDGSVKDIYNLGVGTYDVTVSVGPGYATSRQEAAAVMTELANSAKDPATAAIMRYGAVKNADFEGSEEMARMLKAMLPPQLQQIEEAGAEQMPPQAMAKISQLTQMAQMAQAKLQELGKENMQLKAGTAVDAAKVKAEADAKMAALQLDEAVEKEKARIAREKFEFEKALAIDVANHEADLAERKAQAEHGRKRQELEFQQKCKIDEENTKADHELRPKVDSVIAAGFEVLAAALKEQAEVNKQLMETLSKPKVVNFGGLKRDNGGNLTGASATVQ